MRLQDPAKRTTEDVLRKVGDVIGYSFSKQESSKVVRKVIAVVGPDIIGLS
jgi:hypothetical protein